MLDESTHCSVDMRADKYLVVSYTANFNQCHLTQKLFVSQVVTPNSVTTPPLPPPHSPSLICLVCINYMCMFASFFSKYFPGSQRLNFSLFFFFTFPSMDLAKWQEHIRCWINIWCTKIISTKNEFAKSQWPSCL